MLLQCALEKLESNHMMCTSKTSNTSLQRIMELYIGQFALYQNYVNKKLEPLYEKSACSQLVIKYQSLLLSQKQLMNTWLNVNVSGWIDSSSVINTLLIIVARIENEYQHIIDPTVYRLRLITIWTFNIKKSLFFLFCVSYVYLTFTSSESSSQEGWEGVITKIMKEYTILEMEKTRGFLIQLLIVFSL